MVSLWGSPLIRPVSSRVRALTDNRSARRRNIPADAIKRVTGAAAVAFGVVLDAAPDIV